MNNQLSASVQERILADADKYAFVVPYDGSNKFYNDDKLAGYIAGATAEAERAQVLAEMLPELKDTIEWIWKHMKEADGQTLLQVDHFNRPANALHIIDLAIQQWKEGKESEPEVPDNICGMCKERPKGDGISVCNECYYSFDGDRRGFWNSEDFH